MLGASAVNDPPVADLTTMPSGAVTDPDAATIEITYAPTPVPAEDTLMLFASPPLSPGVGFNGDYRFVASEAGSGTTPLNAAAALTARFGTLQPGMKFFFRLVLVDIGTGARGPDSAVFSTVTT